MQGRFIKDRNINVQHLQKKFKSNVMSRFYFLFIRRGFPDFCDLFLKNISLTYDIFELLIKLKTLKYKLEVHRSGDCSLGTFELYKS